MLEKRKKAKSQAMSGFGISDDDDREGESVSSMSEGFEDPDIDMENLTSDYFNSYSGSMDVEAEAKKDGYVEIIEDTDDEMERVFGEFAYYY